MREGKINLSRADWSRTINYAKWSWRNFSSGERDFSYGEFSTEMDVKNWQCYCKKQIEHNICISHDPYSYWRQNVQNFAVKPWAAGKWLHLSFDVISTIDKSTDHGKLLLFNGTRVGMLTNPEFALNTLNNLAWQTPSNHINTKQTNHKIPLWSLFQTKSTTWLYTLLQPQAVHREIQKLPHTGWKTLKSNTHFCMDLVIKILSENSTELKLGNPDPDQSCALLDWDF